VNLFAGNGMYVRSPDADDSDFRKLKQLGFDALAVNVRDYAWADWKTLITKASTAGIAVVPWARTLIKAEVVSLCRLSSTLPHRNVLVNAENELVDLTVPPEFIASQLREYQLTGCVSTGPWVGTPPVDLSPLAGVQFHLQLFPQEKPGGPSDRPRDCRAHAFEAGATLVSFMTGMHGVDRRRFPPLQRPVWIYTLDDCQQVLEEWKPIDGVALSELVVPFTGPLYGPSHPKYGTRPKRSKTAKGLKITLHEAGFGNFPRPDGVYNAKLEAAMVRLQRWAQVPVTGAYGRGSWLAIRSLTSANIGGTFACTPAASALIKEDAP
jgi:hypothetical protein